MKLPNSISWHMCMFLFMAMVGGVGCIFKIRCPMTTMGTVATLPLGKSLKFPGKISDRAGQLDL